MYSRTDLQNGLRTQVFGKNLVIYDSIDSTNSCAKILAASGTPEGSIVIAENQTEGRGRLGRRWISEPGTCLLFSLVIRPTLEINKVGLLPFFVAAAVAIAIEKATGMQCECKWPNDVLLNGKKCCGILLESTFQHNLLEYAVIGIGININQASFDGDLEETATSLKLAAHKSFDRYEIFRSIVESLEHLYGDIKAGDFKKTLSEWNSRATIFDKQVELSQSGERIYGRAIALSADGGLILETSDGKRIFYAGDVTIIKNNNNATIETG